MNTPMLRLAAVALAATIALPAAAQDAAPDTAKLEKQAKRQIGKFDADGDGKLNAAEVVKLLEARAAKKAESSGGTPEAVDAKKAERYVKRADTDGDGKISQAEWVAQRSQKASGAAE